MSTRRSSEPEVHRITSAPEPLADDVARRQKRYLIQMGIRTVCFLGTVLSWGHVPLWLSVVFLVGAAVLPYVAVLGANAGRERRDTDESFFDPREIGPGSGPARGLGSGR